MVYCEECVSVLQAVLLCSAGSRASLELPEHTQDDVAAARALTEMLQAIYKTTTLASKGEGY
jgi:ribosomal protein S12 methylthiotransferase accessory factor YcaO